MVLLFSETTDCRRGMGGEVWSFCLVRQQTAGGGRGKRYGPVV